VEAEETPSAFRRLPPEYNPHMDGGRTASELFDKWMVPPTSIWVRRNDEGENIVLAFGGAEIVL
jgi:hypothetical protein